MRFTANFVPMRVAVMFMVLAATVAFAACNGGGGQGLSSPRADFSANPLSGYAPLEVDFSDQSFIAGTWEWDLNGNGSVDSEEQNPTFVYYEPGLYTVTLTITGNLQTDSKTVEDYIEVLPAPVQIDVDANRTGTVDPGSGAPSKTTWTSEHGAIFVTNIDNDQNLPNPFMDLQDNVVNGPNDVLDLAPFVLRQIPSGAGLSSGTARVEVGPSAAETYVRIFQNFGGTWTMVYDPSNPGDITIDFNDLLDGDVELGLESVARHGPGWQGRVHLTFIIDDSNGQEVGRDEARMWLAPWIMASNTWPVEQLIVGDIRHGGVSDNTAFYNAVNQICQQANIQFVAYPGASYNWDRWIQDSQEPGVMLFPGPNNTIRRMDVTLQLPRYREADDWCRDVQPTSGFGVMPRFTAPANASSLAYGGNLELVPPAQDDPWGRILVGEAQDGAYGSSVTQVTFSSNNSHNPPNYPTAYRNFHNASGADGSGIQGPLRSVSSEWLAVGHIDEVLMFVPAPNFPRGWALLFADAYGSIDRINQMPASDDSRPVFEGRTTYGWQTSVGAIKADTALEQYNVQVQARLDLIRDDLESHFGITNADVVEVPGSFEQVTGVGHALAFAPGVVNLMPVPVANGDIHFIIPDPEGPSGNDVWRQDTEAALNSLGPGSQIHPHFVDVFYSYHDLSGAAHCGLNTVRTPPDQRWWEE